MFTELPRAWSVQPDFGRHHWDGGTQLGAVTVPGGARTLVRVRRGS